MPGKSFKQKGEEVVRCKRARIPFTMVYMQLKPLNQPPTNRRLAPHHGIVAINGGQIHGKPTRRPGSMTTNGSKRSGEPARKDQTVCEGRPSAISKSSAGRPRAVRTLSRRETFAVLFSVAKGDLCHSLFGLQAGRQLKIFSSL